MAGAIIVVAGYQVAFWTLAAIAAAGVVLYAVLMPETRDEPTTPAAVKSGPRPTAH